MFFGKTVHLSPARMILIGFALLILVGTGLLMLPISTNSPGGATFLDALFTATSATCVTGLVVHDTALYWTPFGQAVILILIQIGGMGVVTVAIAIAMLSGKKIGLRQRWVMQESIAAPQVGGIVRLTGFVLKMVLLLESIGAILLALRFCPEVGLLRGIWYGVFHSISAFCNAGFDLFGVRSPFSSLTGHTGDPVVNLVVMLLIITGGLGFLTWHDIKTHKWHLHAYRLQSKLILAATMVLLLLPGLFLFFYEFSQPQWANLSLQERIFAAAFQAVTPRTAGYNTVDLTQMSQPSQLLLVLLMLTGGAPGSTAGGFKVTTLAVLFLTTSAVIRRKSSAQCFGRRIAAEVLPRAVTIFFLYLSLCLLGTRLLCSLEEISLMQALFECASAIGTVGLSLGMTPDLGSVSKVILIFLMYLGRVGGLTLVFAIWTGGAMAPAQLPQEKVTVG